MAKVLNYVLLVCFVGLKTPNAEAGNCPSVNGTTNQVLWPSTIDRILSQPLCVDEKRELLYRECNNSHWLPEPSCFYIQPEVIPQCPEGFQETEKFCYMLTPKSKFSASCPYPNVVPFPTAVKILTSTSEPVWVPATRDPKNLEFIHWIEPNSLYKTNVDYNSTGAANNKNCLIYDYTRNYTLEDCNEKHPRLCVYQKLSFLINKLCPGCYQSTYSSRTSCFCIQDNDGTGAKAELTELYQNGIFSTNEFCSFGLEKTDQGKYIWSGSQKEINYTFWSKDAIFDPSHRHGAWTPQGWVLLEAPEPFVLIQTEVPEQEPLLDLTFDKTENVFVLNVTNPLWLEDLGLQEVFCFTDADARSLIYRYPSLNLKVNTSDLKVYTFEPIQDYPGRYWCEGFKFSTLENIRIEMVWRHPNNYYEFVAYFGVPIPSSVDHLTPKVLPVLYEHIIDKLNIANNETRYYPRIKELVWFDEEDRTLIVNVHFSSFLKQTDSEAQKEYYFYTLKQPIEAALREDNKNVNLIYFYSSDFCVSRNISYKPGLYLHWPLSPIYTYTTSSEFCFLGDGNLLYGYCAGNFTEGAVWIIPPNSDCKILQPSSTTTTLKELFMQQSLSRDDINKILGMNFQEFVPLDVYFLTKVFLFFFLEVPDLNLFSTALESVFQIDKKVLMEAQLTAKSTDILLYTLENIMPKSPEIVQVANSDFVLVHSPVINITGLVVNKYNNTRNVSILNENMSITRFLQKFEDFEMGVWLNPQLVKQVDPETPVTFLIYFNNLFFTDKEISSKNISTVFSVFLNSSSRLQAPVTIIQQMKQASSCMAWFYDVSYLPGLWVELSIPQNITSYQFCDFWQTGNIALATVANTEKNITADLVVLLSDSMIASDRMTVLADISDWYETFNPVDVLLVGKVLNLTKNSYGNDMGSLAKVVDNLHKIKKPVLSQSQEQHNATDLILYNIDDIAKKEYNVSEDVLVTTQNFVLFVSRWKQSNMTGLLLSYSNDTYQTEILTDGFNITDIQQYENISSVLLLSSELKEEIPEDGQIVITIFFSDVLFNEKRNHTTFGKIFGVILPEISNFSGPITIFHNVSNRDSLECAHWNFSINNTSSLWKKDSNAGNLSDLIRCDFYHTTHFALLLLNNDQYQGYDVMDWITTINCGISLVGLCCIVLTAVLFDKWRRNIGNQILLNFSFAIILQIVCFYIAGTINRHNFNYFTCTLIGVLLHFSVVAQFCWTLTIAILQFKRFVTVFGTSTRFLLLKACVCGWVFPILPVMLSLVVSDEKYAEGTAGLCYPTGLGLYLGIWIPVGVISVTNLCIFLYIMLSIIRANSDNVARKHEGKHQWRLFVLLFFMLGLTWVFGFMAGFSFGTFFAYIFCFTATLQGFVLFLYFIVFNGKTRYLYVHSIKSFIANKGF